MKKLKDRILKEIQLEMDKIQIKLDEIEDELSQKSRVLLDEMWELQELKDRI